MTFRVLTKDNCVQCDSTKRLLTREEATFVEENIYENMELVKNLGFMSAPVVIAPSGDAWSGFQPDKIKEHTAKRP